MAITAAQRKIALDAVLQSYNNFEQLQKILPGVLPASVLTSLVAAIGSNFDTQLMTVLAAKVTDAQSQLGILTTNQTNTQANITAWTVT